MLSQSGYYFTKLVTIYEAGSCFLRLVYIHAELVYIWCISGVYFAKMMPIYEAGSCFLKLVYISAELVYGWCMAGVC